MAIKCERTKFTLVEKADKHTGEDIEYTYVNFQLPLQMDRQIEKLIKLQINIAFKVTGWRENKYLHG